MTEYIKNKSIENNKKNNVTDLKEIGEAA